MPYLMALEAASPFSADGGAVRRCEAVEAPPPEVHRHRTTGTAQVLQTLLAGTTAFVLLPPGRIRALRDEHLSRPRLEDDLRRWRVLHHRRLRRDRRRGATKQQGFTERRGGGAARGRGRAGVSPPLTLGTTYLGPRQGRGRVWLLGGGGRLRMHGRDGGRRAMNGRRRGAGGRGGAGRGHTGVCNPGPLFLFDFPSYLQIRKQ